MVSPSSAPWSLDPPCAQLAAASHGLRPRDRQMMAPQLPRQSLSEKLTASPTCGILSQEG